MNIQKIKIGMLVFLAVYLVFLCRAQTAGSVEIGTVETAMEADGLLSSLTQGDADTLKEEFSLRSSDYSGTLIYTSGSFLDVDVLLIVRAQTTDQLDELESAAQAWITKEEKKFQGYGTEQMALLEQAVTREKGRYFFFCVSEQADQWEKVFASCV